MSRWSAVVRGAVIYGVEKSYHKKLAVMTACPRSYGIILHHTYSGVLHDSRDRQRDAITNRDMANGQLTWLLRKGDLLLSDEPRESEKEFAFNFREMDERKVILPIYEYLDDDIPDRYETAQQGSWRSLRVLIVPLPTAANIPPQK